MTLGVAGLPERLVIDASHDNSAKDPEKQFFAAGEIADQIADGNKAIVGVMLESFLVEGRQDLVPGEELTYGQSITDPCLDWEDDRLRPRALRLGGRGSAQLTEGQAPRVAVLGVGLIGGSIGLAARRRLEAEVVGYSRSPATVERALELGALDRGAASVAEACEGAEVVFCAAPVGGAARPAARRPCRPAAPTPSSPTSARPSASWSPRSAATSASSAATRWPAPRPPASTTPAPTSSRAPAGT